MLPIPFLSTALPQVLPSGVPPMAGVSPVDFAVLLPGLVAPVMPRQDDAEGGKGLPASPADDVPDVAEPGVAWVIPPIWPAICPPIDAVRGEVAAPTSGAAPVGETKTVVAPPVAPVVLPVAGESETVAPAIDDRLPGAGADKDPAPVLAGPRLVPGRRREVQPVPTHPDLPASAMHTSPATRTTITPSMPSERRAAVVHGPAHSLERATVGESSLAQASVPASVTAASLLPEPLTPVASPMAVDRPSVAAIVPAQASAPAERMRIVAKQEAPAIPAAAQWPTMVLAPTIGSTGRQDAVAVTAGIERPAPALADAVGTTPKQDAPTLTTGAQRLAFGPSDATGTVPREETPSVTADAERPAPTSAARPTPQAELQPLQPTRIAPAAEMFAAAIQRAVRDERRPAANDLAGGIVAPTGDLATRAGVAPDASRHPPLDMARETWPAKMIERIEMLRDAVDAVDTSVRLMPDQLGAIDVSLRKEGDTVHVQFTAQQAETRQLLADAQPKLAELAEAKGLRLAMQAGGEGAAGQQPQQQQRAAASALPITAPRASSEDDGSAADERIA
jgi:flagellar hook-length control protein FliK